MVVSSRAVAAVSLGLIGVMTLTSALFGQQSDGAVRKTTTQGTTVAPPAPATFGTIDMTAVFKGYDKVKVSGQEFQAAVMAKKKDLMGIMQQMQQESESLAKMAPGSSDAKKIEDKLTQLKASNEAGREQAEREFSLREAEMLATLYKEIQTMVARVAVHRHMTYVLRVSNDPVTGSDPNSAMRAIERSVVYAEATNDITKDVVQYLNAEYKSKGGVAPKATSSVTPSPTSVKPAGN
ncbi:outer membrane protein [Singulisphaera sp. GP187]|uniref:OmpH family outer membrane protein n=1 Tax=Singulisphaera sp. GP187 TaxID=1882752 RepID=UPI00092BBE70|nr:OmpH family outer membrane protein [Singulisphaera sp. GP187]SIN90549.1 outer membrane protein [Singulisphaera sp. GP187]